MPRLARVIIPNIPHHITQRGNRRQPVFFSEEDRQLYVRVLLDQSRRYGVTFWAYCLMDNHVHFVAVPQAPDSFARAFGEAHRRYTSVIHQREGWTGYLWQGRFASFPLDEARVVAAVRYVERNPVVAGMVRVAEEYPWSSARAHVLKRHDPLVSACFLEEQIRDWAAYLGEERDEERALIERHSRTGRPLGSAAFVERLEQITGRPLTKQRAGRKRKLVSCP